jgi:hypothetical protein
MLSAEDLFVGAGVSPRLIREFLDPILQVGCHGRELPLDVDMGLW